MKSDQVIVSFSGCVARRPMTANTLVVKGLDLDIFEGNSDAARSLGFGQDHHAA